MSVNDELNFLSDALSTRSRSIATGIAIFCWTALITEEMAPARANSGPFAIALLMAISAIGADFLQYVFGYCSAMRTRARGDNTFPENETFRILRFVFFYIKISACLVAVVFLLLGILVTWGDLLLDGLLPIGGA